ncbi:hypothetical protein TbgDal_XI3880 [Trypanosoma brucei gambiense DAL972]|uniref:Uncharacterized protein n=1 Tax=Trypanosoma brucei gambiense (strain MHOM/CI/86/DAL972) TaxID=679716 RepID=D0A6G9_TRYB9|nr:hypothetical protein TbgDal_XI3880 [Trypanosoma brucei gambiense DAL972]CBH17270.1 hypothetical protein TbgDal_XI3880 [Trypanosoma brucei gambiense DAL972]|eukprot:XP_011779534.1 hypothetical protein TbgDal_XI3880 [Trypanosoma brucei gambiense DAL972]
MRSGTFLKALFSVDALVTLKRERVRLHRCTRSASPSIFYFISSPHPCDHSLCQCYCLVLHSQQVPLYKVKGKTNFRSHCGLLRQGGIYSEHTCQFRCCVLLFSFFSTIFFLAYWLRFVLLTSEERRGGEVTRKVASLFFPFVKFLLGEGLHTSSVNVGGGKKVVRWESKMLEPLTKKEGKYAGVHLSPPYFIFFHPIIS